MSRANVRKHPVKSTASITQTAAKSVTPTKSSITTVETHGDQAVGHAMATPKAGKRPPSARTQNKDKTLTSSSTDPKKPSKNSSEVAHTPEHAASTSQSKPPQPDTRERSRSPVATSTRTMTTPREFCRKFAAGRCKNKNCPRIHVNNSCPSSISVLQSQLPTSNTPSTRSCAGAENLNHLQDIPLSVPCHRPMLSSNKTNTPVSTAQARPPHDGDQSNILHIPSVLPTPQGPASTADKDASSASSLTPHEQAASQKVQGKHKPTSSQRGSSASSRPPACKPQPADPVQLDTAPQSLTTVPHPPTEIVRSSTPESENAIPRKVVCRNYLRDRCRLGVRCHRYHPPRYEWHLFIPKTNEPCKAYENGQCFLGDKCYRYHPPDPAERSSPEPSVGATSENTVAEQSGTRTGDRRKFRHSRKEKSTVRPDSRTETVASGTTLVADVRSPPLPTKGPADSKGKGKVTDFKHDEPCVINLSQAKETDGSSSDATTYYSLDQSSPDSSPRLNKTRSTALQTGKVPAGRSRPPCRDFLAGKCNRLVCKFSHERPDDHMNRLVNMLEQSSKSAELPRVPRGLEPENRKPSICDPVPQSQKPIPAVPPGLGLEEGPANKADATRTRVTLSYLIDDAQVTFAPGFEVVQLRTGFESRKIVLRNIPSSVKEDAVRDVLSHFGSVLEVQMWQPRRTSARTTASFVRATFATHLEASEAVSALNGAHVFGSSIEAQLATHKSTTVGKGVVHDGDLLLEFPAPCVTGYLGFSTLERAERAVSEIKGSVLDDLRLFATCYNGIPKVGAYNVKVMGLPPNTQVEDLARFGSDQGGMVDSGPKYTDLKEAAYELQDVLERYGELLAINIGAPPHIRQTIRAWAHFTSPDAAKRAFLNLHNKPQYFLGGSRITALHVQSVMYKLPPRVFEMIKHDVRKLRPQVCPSDSRCDVRVLNRNSQNPDAPVKIKILAGQLPVLTKLKTAFEELLRGERVKHDGEDLWDPFFSRTAGAAFIHELEERYGMLINRDSRRRTISLYGSQEKREAARAALVAQVQYVRSRQRHTFPLEGRLIGLFMSADLMKLQQKLGHENVTLDLSRKCLTIRGDEDAVNVTQDVLRKAKHRHFIERGRQGTVCPVCFDEVSVPVTLPCGHAWCKSCLANYLVASIDTRVFPLKCLGNDARCPECIPLDIAHDIITPKDYNAVMRAAFLAYVQSRPKEFHYCPTPDCSQIYRRAPPDTVLQCPSCLVRICGNCHVEYHEGSFCPDRDKEDRKLFEGWTKSHDVKMCPGCRAPIERIAGCNHMTCARCKTHICWVCLSTFSRSEDVYDHMHAMHGGIGL